MTRTEFDTLARVWTLLCRGWKERQAARLTILRMLSVASKEQSIEDVYHDIIEAEAEARPPKRYNSASTTKAARKIIYERV